MADDLPLRTSASLLHRLRDPGDRSAWAAFVERYGGAIYTWCRRWNLQEADAEDLTQGILLEIPRKMRNFVYDPSRGSFRGWLKQVVRSALSDLAQSQARAGRQAAVSQPLDTVEAGDDLLKELEEKFERELLEEAMARVEPRVSKTTWESFRLTAIEDLSGKEAAGRLQIPIAHVYVYRNRVQKMLQEEIRKLEGPEA